MNHKKRIAIYLLLLFGLFLLTMAVPRVLHTVTGKIVQKAAKQLERDTEQSLYQIKETKMQTEHIERNLPDETESEGQTDPEETQPATVAGSEPSQKQAEEMQTQLEAARRNFHPAYNRDRPRRNAGADRNQAGSIFRCSIGLPVHALRWAHRSTAD